MKKKYLIAFLLGGALLITMFQNASWPERDYFAETTLLEIRSLTTTLDQNPNSSIYIAYNSVEGAEAHLASNKGICLVRYNGEATLQPINLTTETDCLSKCVAAVATDVASPKTEAINCKWRNKTITPSSYSKSNPQTNLAMCRIRNAVTHAVIGTDAYRINSECHNLCTNYTASLKYCEWGQNRFFDQPAGTECRIFDGYQKKLGDFGYAANESECLLRCNSFSSHEDRSCLYGNKYLKAASESRLCEVIGGVALKPLVPLFYDSLINCQRTCDQFIATNPNRKCYHGKSQFFGTP